MKWDRMIDAALFRLWDDRTPLSSKGKRLRGVNARRRRQARQHREMREACALINRDRPEALKIHFGRLGA